jgi:glycosyltransferase involved in cell wall biosynthesis
MSDSTVPGLTSIIIPCWNELEFTRQCITAIKNHTHPPWELIVIDNGSTDGTGIYLAGVRDLAAVPVTLVTNTTNLGFPAAINQGLGNGTGTQIVFHGEWNGDANSFSWWLPSSVAGHTVEHS